MSNDKPHQLILDRARGDLIGETCYPVYLRSGESRSLPTYDRYKPQYGLFHLAVWLAGNPGVDDFMIACELPQSPTVNTYEVEKMVIFGQKEDRDAFLEWQDKVSGWFVRRGMDDEFIPTLPITGTYTLNFTSFDIPNLNMGAEHFIDAMFEAWVWLAHNCLKGVWRIEGGFAFACAEDAVKFKLAYDLAEV